MSTAKNAIAVAPADKAITGPDMTLRNADEWCKILDVTIMDADGWDKKNFDESWAEKITRQEFVDRGFRSTMASNERLRDAGWNV